MGLSYSEKQRLIQETKTAAAAFIEDLAYIRTLVQSRTRSPTDIRLLSNVLRRLLHENDLTTLASPRLGKIHLMCPDNDGAVRKSSDLMVLYQTGCPLFLPLNMHGIAIKFESKPSEDGTINAALGPDAAMPLKQVRVDGFLAQSVICFYDKWASRRDAIKFAAINAHGVHSQAPRNAKEELLAQARYAVRFSKTESGVPKIELDFDVIGNPANGKPGVFNYRYDPERLDLVPIEVLSAAYYLVNSPDVKRLEDFIRDELS